METDIQNWEKGLMGEGSDWYFWERSKGRAVD